MKVQSALLSLLLLPAASISAAAAPNEDVQLAFVDDLWNGRSHGVIQLAHYNGRIYVAGDEFYARLRCLYCTANNTESGIWDYEYIGDMEIVDGVGLFFTGRPLDLESPADHVYVIDQDGNFTQVFEHPIMDPPYWRSGVLGCNGAGYFVQRGGNLVVSNGTVEGTRPIHPPELDGSDFVFKEFFCMESTGTLVATYKSANGAGNNKEFWATKDHGETWELLASIVGSFQDTDISPETPGGVRLFEVTDYAGDELSLWMTDGTPQGTAVYLNLTFGIWGFKFANDLRNGEEIVWWSKECNCIQAFKSPDEEREVLFQFEEGYPGEVTLLSANTMALAIEEESSYKVHTTEGTYLFDYALVDPENSEYDIVKWWSLPLTGGARTLLQVETTLGEAVWITDHTKNGTSMIYNISIAEGDYDSAFKDAQPILVDDDQFVLALRAYHPDTGEFVGVEPFLGSYTPNSLPAESYPALKCEDTWAGTDPPLFGVVSDDCAIALANMKNALGEGLPLSCCSCGSEPGECAGGEWYLVAQSQEDCEMVVGMISDSTNAILQCFELCANKSWFIGGSQEDCEAGLDVADFTSIGLSVEIQDDGPSQVEKRMDDPDMP